MVPNLQGRRRSRFAFGIETNQEVAADTDQFPEDEDLENVPGQHQS